MNIEEYKKLTTSENRKIIIDLFEKVQTKYSKMSYHAEKEGKSDIAGYMTGVADGINHCRKILEGIRDDYLDGIEGIN